jgi:DNA polymerase-3 subunit delta'
MPTCLADLLGIGKFMIAQDFAKVILCDNPTDTYCGSCDVCKAIQNTADFKVLEPIDGLIKVDAIRGLSDEIMLKPTLSKRKVFIIRDAECMNESAQNALLKILEEPPTYATIILVVSNKEQIIKTIKSRCTILDFQKLSNDELKSIFKDDNISDDLLLFSNGSAEKYLKLKDSNYLEGLTLLEKALEQNDLLDINKAMNTLRQVKTIKEDIYEIFDLLILKLGSNLLENQAKKIKQIEAIEQVRNNLKHNANFDTSLDYLMVQLWEINS